MTSSSDPLRLTVVYERVAHSEPLVGWRVDARRDLRSRNAWIPAAASNETSSPSWGVRRGWGEAVWPTFFDLDPVPDGNALRGLTSASEHGGSK